MRYQILENKNLQLILEEADREEVAELLENASHKDHGFLADLLEYAGWSQNGVLHSTGSDEIGGLTDAPMLTDELEHADDGTVSHIGRLWYFSDYQVHSFGEELLRDGVTTFTYYVPQAGDRPMSR